MKENVLRVYTTSQKFVTINKIYDMFDGLCPSDFETTYRF
jgi:hypothetical protein